MAVIATGNREDALDILQEAMVRLVQKYADRNPGEWPPLFQTILQSRIRDWYRRNAVRNRFRVWLGNHDAGEPDPLLSVADENEPGPEKQVLGGQQMDRIEQALHSLPLRQQQAFLLRSWEGLDVRQTAKAMKCSEGSVKTHYSRAITALRNSLGEFKP